MAVIVLILRMVHIAVLIYAAVWFENKLAMIALLVFLALSSEARECLCCRCGDDDRCAWR